jgi:hypothetical protein
MSKISAVGLSSIHAFTNDLGPRLRGAKAIEEAAQLAVGAVFEQYRESVVLARLYATVPLQELPATNRDFVTRLAQSKGRAAELREKTPVLSLMGTRGVEPAWNDRARSAGHVGIPLLSADFVEEIPMLARLLADVGLATRWIETQDPSLLDERSSKFGKIFYVESAKEATDHRGRHVIPARDFVQAHDVATVFGVAGAYLMSNVFLALLVFCRERLDETRGRAFLPLVSVLKAETTRLVSQRRFFA